MPTRIGVVAALFRYPVKSMGGEAVESSDLGWHGLDGDRRLGLRKVNDRAGFPWLQASRLPELVLFTPERRGATGPKGLPTHVRTPDGQVLDIFGPELAGEVARRFGAPVEMTHLDRGIFDEAPVSVITPATIDAIGRLAAHPLEVRRFRPNVLLASDRPVPFEEDAWVGGVLRFGDAADAASVAVTNRDVRCSMVNLDPDTAHPTAEVLKVIVRERSTRAGVYGTVTVQGRLAVGQPVYFEPAGAGRAAGMAAPSP